MKKLLVLVIAVATILTGTITAFADDTTTVAPAKPVQVQELKVLKNGYSSLKLSWAKIDDAEKYQVYRATSKSGKYKLKATVNDATYTNTGLTSGKTYYYKVRAVNSAGKGIFSAIKSNKVQPSKVKLTGVTYYNKGSNASESKVKLRVGWNKISGASGYEVYRRTTKKSSTNGAYDIDVNGSYKKIATVSSKKLYYIDGMTDFAKSYADAASRQYEYKVRAYRIVNGKKVYGYFSVPGHYEKDWTVDGLIEQLIEYGESIVLYEYDSLKEPILDEYGEETYVVKTDRTYSIEGDIDQETAPYDASWGPLWPVNLSNIYNSEKYLYEDLKGTVKCSIETVCNANPQGYDCFGEWIRSGVGFYFHTEKKDNGSILLYCYC